MEELITPLSDLAIANILQTAQSFIGRSSTALERVHPRSRRKHPDSNTYVLPIKEASLLWITNIFDVCDISILQFKHSVDTENCCKLCNSKLELIKPQVWVDQDTIIHYNVEASGQGHFLIGWRYSSLLR